MDPNEDVIVICFAKSDPRVPDNAIDGSTLEVCAVCGEEIWASPSSKSIVEKESGRLVCTRCGYDIAEADDEFHLMDPTPEQRDEIARHQEHHV